jgi:predicted TIM-barrel fold metal-dependent hydrolase
MGQVGAGTNGKRRTYRRVDADSHVNEPPSLWVDRVPTAYKERVPHMKRFEQGDAWVMEGVPEPINFGRNVRLRDSSFSTVGAEGVRSAWVKWEDVSPGGYQPADRLGELDIDLVDAAVFFPTPRIAQMTISTEDPDLHGVLVSAYNDWLIEFCSHAPDRLGAQILLPNRGIDQALAEIERIGGETAVTGVLFGCYPHGDPTPSPEDDVVWHALADRGLAIHTHAAVENTKPIDAYAPGRALATKAGANLRFMKAPNTIFEFVSSGVFDRVPELKVVMAEVDAGWVPYVKQELDNRARRAPGAGDKPLPSAVIEEHFYYTYITDHVAIHSRHWIGVDRIMWSSDFPHSATDWPLSWRTIDADFATVPADERDRILAKNALELYRFDQK